MELLVVVPARGGSKGIPKKNSKRLGGKPLLLHTLELARQLVPDNRILLSTDDAELAQLAQNAGLPVPFLRPQELATDEAGMFPVLQHALNWYQATGNKPDVVVLLQPTSPFRTAQQVREAIALYTPESDMVASVKQTKANPYFVLFEESQDEFLQPSKSLPAGVLRRQDAPPVYELNGAIYVINPEALSLKKSFAEFTRIRKYEMDALTSVDLDTELDWLFAEFLLERKLTNGHGAFSAGLER